MTSGSLLNWLLLGVGVAYAQALPPDHSPGGAARTGGHLCKMGDETTVIGEVKVINDATIFEGFGDSAASKDSFIAGKTSSGARRALLKFDLAGADFPPDFQIICAEIRLSLDMDLSSSDAGPLEITLHEVTTPWITNGNTPFEGLDGTQAMDGDVTWEYAIHPSIKWTNQGGDFGGDILSWQQKNPTPTPSPDRAFEYKWFGSTHLMHSLVNRWIKDSNTNHGVLIKSEEQPFDPIAYNVYHGWEAAPNLVPKLVVVYTSPSLGYPHKGNPYVGDNYHQVGDVYDNNDGSPSTSPVNSGNPNVGDNYHQVGDGYDNNDGGPSTGPVNSNDGSSNGGDSGGISSALEDEAFRFDRESNSNTEFVAAALTITALVLVGVVASLFGRNQRLRETMGELADNTVEDTEPPQSATQREIV